MPSSTQVFSPKSLHTSTKSNSYNQELEEYVASFHPYFNPNADSQSEGISICLLKKDGSWDAVDYYSFYYLGMTFSMSRWNLHYDNDQYARTMDGYLRARITEKYRTGSGSISSFQYHSTFFIVDYLPQKAKLYYDFLNASTLSKSDVQATGNAIPVRLYFADIEGFDRVVLERFRGTSRVPSKIEIKDFKKGYYDTTIDITTTFTIVGYNENGTTRGTPLKIEPTSATNGLSDLNLSIENESVILNTLENYTNLRYEILPLTTSNVSTKSAGYYDGPISIESLHPGLYVINLYTEGSFLGQLKFKKISVAN